MTSDGHSGSDHQWFAGDSLAIAVFLLPLLDPGASGSRRGSPTGPRAAPVGKLLRLV